MELLESQNPEKRKLIETSERHKRELEKEVNEISERTQKIVTNALIIGGSLALTYFLVSRFSGSKAKTKRKKIRIRPTIENEEIVDEGEAEDNSFFSAVAPTLISQIGNKVINQATLILLDLAREKLKDYLHPRKEKDENS